MTIKFYINKEDETPADSYQVDYRDAIAYASHNWLQMHPNGKVEITA